MAFHSAKMRTVLFGGESRDGLCGDTWLWNTNRWVQVKKLAVQPPARRDASMAYDAMRRRIVLFGGHDGTRRCNDTWEWDGKRWHECKPKRRPSPRQGHAMVYDRRMGRVLLFGGSSNGGRKDDTWSWDGATWARVKTAARPPARDGAALAFDSARQRAVLFGGRGNRGMFADTWEWDGTNWSEVEVKSGLSARCDHAMAYDATHKCMTVFGGRGERPLADVWQFDGSNWQEVSFQKGPESRSSQRFVYEPQTRHLVLFGGRRPGGKAETWVFHQAYASDNQAGNMAVGLGGGAGGRYGTRGRGRERAIGGKTYASAIGNGLKWLAEHQRDNGSFGDDIGDTGLALLALLGDGNTMRSGPFKANVKRGVRWLRDNQQPDGRFISEESDTLREHAIAAFAMSEAYGLSEFKLVRPMAQRALDYLESQRDPKSVWRREQGGTDLDLETTGWALLANETAHFFGLRVNKVAQEQCLKFLDSIADATAKARNRVGERERPEVLAAVGLFSRYFVGQSPKDTPVMRVTADLVGAHPPVWGEKHDSVDPYYWFYGTYALFQFGGPHWRTWQKELAATVLKHQNRDESQVDAFGSWDPVGVRGGSRVQMTAMLTLTLQAYYRYGRLAR